MINYHLTYFSVVDVLYGILHVTIISCCSRSKTSTKWRWCIVLHWCPQAYFSAVFFQFFELCKVFWWRILFCLSGENQLLMNESNQSYKFTVWNFLAFFRCQHNKKSGILVSDFFCKTFISVVNEYKKIMLSHARKYCSKRKKNWKTITHPD